MPGLSPSAFSMRGHGWQAIWTFIAILAAIRTVGELFRHGWSGIVAVGLVCTAICAVFALLARRRGGAPAAPALVRAPFPRRRPADPIEPGRRFF